MMLPDVSSANLAAENSLAYFESLIFFGWTIFDPNVTGEELILDFLAFLARGPFFNFGFLI